MAEGAACSKFDVGSQDVDVWELHAFLLVVSCGTLMAWTRRQYDQQSEGYYSSDQLAIFPMHLKLLVVLAFFALLQAALIITANKFNEFRDEERKEQDEEEGEDEPDEKIHVVVSLLKGLGMLFCEGMKGTTPHARC